MNSYVIFSDPGCDFSIEEANRLNVTILPYLINIGDKSYVTTLSWDNFSEKELFSMVKDQAPSFSRPPLGDWFNIIEDKFKQGLDVLYIGMTQKITGSINSLSVIYKSLSEKYQDRKLITIDSLTVGRSLALYVEKAAKNLQEGMSLEENEQYIKSNLNTAKMFWIPKKSLLFKITNRGDASSLNNVNKFTILKITEDGQFVPDQSFKSKKEVYDLLSKEKGRTELSFTNDFTEKKAKPILKNFYNPEVHYGSSPFTSVVCGPKTVGVMIIKK